MSSKTPPYTKGRWYVQHDPYRTGNDVTYVRSDTRGLHPYIAEAIGGLPDDQIRANAALMAKAPEMFEALKKARHYLSEIYDGMNMRVADLIDEIDYILLDLQHLAEQ